MAFANSSQTEINFSANPMADSTHPQAQGTYHVPVVPMDESVWKSWLDNTGQNCLEGILVDEPDAHLLNNVLEQMEKVSFN